jgi:acyl-coenzyme A thioesterase PaaI-like protein
MKFVDKIQHQIDRFMPSHVQATAILQLYGLWKIPLLFAVRPKVKKISDQEIIVEIPLNRITKNHLGSMYFGTLAIGADCAIGLLAVHHIDARKAKVGLIFKDFQANFLKRAEGNVLFICNEGEKIQALVEQVIRSGERKNMPISARAVSKKNPEVVLADFVLTLSLKRKS